MMDDDFYNNEYAEEQELIDRFDKMVQDGGSTIFIIMSMPKSRN